MTPLFEQPMHSRKNMPSNRWVVFRAVNFFIITLKMDFFTSASSQVNVLRTCLTTEHSNISSALIWPKRTRNFL